MSSEGNKDELIEAQKQVIGILFEIVRRLQTNSDLDREYLEMIIDGNPDKAKMDAISGQRNENAEIIGRLLEQLDD